MTDQEKNLNLLAKYLGVRDVNSLTSKDLYAKYKIHQADVMVLFGGSILAGGDVLAKAIQEKVAKHYVIVGGQGHTTQTFREVVHDLTGIETFGLTEAEIFNAYIKEKYRVQADLLETKSTNCGNNITNLLALLKENQISCNSIILCQDATMQRRMDAILKKYSDIKIINYATYQVEIKQKEIVPCPLGMWKLDRYIELLMGEIPRLMDDENGYGPKGKDYLVHVDIPKDVYNAFLQLTNDFNIRIANEKYAS